MRTVVVVGLLALIAQFYRPDKNLGIAEGPESLAHLYQVPEPVRQSLRVACYDCHSDRTSYPWYAELQPMGWWLAGHVRDGKAALNLSRSAGWSKKQVSRKLLAMVDMVETGEMPLASYTLAHPNARLTTESSRRLVDWAEQLAEDIQENEN